MSSVTCRPERKIIILSFFFSDKAVELFGGGSVITRATRLFLVHSTPEVAVKEEVGCGLLVQRVQYNGLDIVPIQDVPAK
jgi:hypothetical protein